jgi:hypothetical protein
MTFTTSKKSSRTVSKAHNIFVSAATPQHRNMEGFAAGGFTAPLSLLRSPKPVRTEQGARARSELEVLFSTHAPTRIPDIGRLLDDHEADEIRLVALLRAEYEREYEYGIKNVIAYMYSFHQQLLYSREEPVS